MIVDILKIVSFYNELAKVVLFGIVFFDVIIESDKRDSLVPRFGGCIALGVLAGILSEVVGDSTVVSFVRGLLLIIAVKLLIQRMNFKVVLLGVVVTSLADCLFAYLFMAVTGFSSAALSENANLSFFINFILTIFLLLIWAIKKVRRYKGFNINCVISVFNMVLISVLMSGVIIAYAEMYVVGNTAPGIHLVGDSLILISGLFFVAQCLILFFRSENKRLNEDLANKEQILQGQKTYFADLISKDEQVRRFRHDLRGHLGCISALVDEEDYSGLKEYLKSLNGQVEKLYLEYSTGNHIVNAIISDIKNQYPGVDIKWKGKIPSEISINDMDLCVIFYNLLNNACREVCMQENPSVDVDVKIFNTNLFITVNNVIVHDVMIKDNRRVIKQFKENHGYGLRNVEDAVLKYDGKFMISGDNGMFNVDIALMNVI